MIKEARKALSDIGWSEDCIDMALNPNCEQAKERGAIFIAEVNPEQHSAIRCLQRLGWGAHDISLAIPVPESEIVKVLLLEVEGIKFIARINLEDEEGE